jgi:hypothetical protein
VEKRYKLELEMYGTEEAIDKFIDALQGLDIAPFTQDDYTELDLRKYSSNFSPKKFFKMCEDLEKKAAKYFQKLEKQGKKMFKDYV